MKLTEAFRALNALNEDTFSVSDDGIAKLAEFEQNDDLADDISVIDPEAETEEDLEDSYVGKIILDCTVCHSKLYKDIEEIELDEEQTLANVGEECPYCYTSDGFKVLGQVSAFGGKTEESEDDDTTTDDVDDAKPADTDDKDDDVVVAESLQEAVATLERPMSAIGGTLSNVMAAHSDELANVYDRASAISFLDAIEPEVKNKGYLQSIKEKISKLPDRRATQFLYNIILKGDGMGRRVEEDLLVRGEDGKLTTTSQDGRWGNSKEWNYNNEELEEGLFGKRKASKATSTFKVVDGQHKNTIKGGFKTKDDAYDWLENNKEPEEYSKFSVVAESLTEDVNNVNVETDDSIVNVATDNSGKVTVTTEPKTVEETPADGTEVITPLTDENEAALFDAPVDEPVEDEFTDVELDEFDDETFDGLGEGYLKKVYENVQSYKTTDCSMKDDKIILEGVITFNSGTKKKTSFIFEAKDFTKSGKYRFIGENTQLTRGKKAFTLKGRIDEGKFITESFNYNYKAKDTAGNSTRIYGTIKG